MHCGIPEIYVWKCEYPLSMALKGWFLNPFAVGKEND
jgi:hypothetical protein